LSKPAGKVYWKAIVSEPAPARLERAVSALRTRRPPSGVQRRPSQIQIEP
jgi:hypothetical protein